MSAEARANGWRGFDGIGQRTEGGYLYRCDGMPNPVGCGKELVVTRRLARVGMKSSGWLVCYGIDDDGTDDKDVVLTFCPECAAVVTASRTDKRASDPVSDAKGGYAPEGTDETNRPDLVMPALCRGCGHPAHRGYCRENVGPKEPCGCEDQP